MERLGITLYKVVSVKHGEEEKTVESSEKFVSLRKAHSFARELCSEGGSAEQLKFNEGKALVGNSMFLDENGLSRTLYWIWIEKTEMPFSEIQQRWWGCSLSESASSIINQLQKGDTVDQRELMEFLTIFRGVMLDPEVMASAQELERKWREMYK